MESMQETLWTEYGVNVNTSQWNERVTNDWDRAQTLVRSTLNSTAGLRYRGALSS